MWNASTKNPIINALLWIYSLVGNFGVAIIVVFASYVQYGVLVRV
jgi:membrane protein insertase Oxa1/YidC/SpoIIIJ